MTIVYTLPMSPALIITKPVTREFLKKMAEERYGDMVKAVVDLKRRMIALGTHMHADAEEILLNDGSKQEDLWGVNIYPEKSGDLLIEVDSMINIRPWQNNRSRDITDTGIRSQVIELAISFILP